MATATVIINVDLARPGTLPRIYAVQGEKGSRIIRFRLYENGAEWIEATNAATTVHFRRADGTGGSFDGQAVSGNDVYVTLSEAVCAKAGPVNLVVELSENATVIVTWPVTVQVAANPGCQPMEEDPQGGSQSGSQAGSGSCLSQYIIDLSEKVSLKEEDFSKYGIDVSSLVDAAAVLAAKENGSQIVLKLQKGDTAGEYVFVPLDYHGSENAAQGVVYSFGGATCVFRKSLSMAQLRVNADDPLQLDAFVFIRSVPTDSLEQPRSVDMTNYEAGKIRLTYANDEAMDVSVEFDTNGNPIKFSNGTEEFTVTWPEEVVTDE